MRSKRYITKILAIATLLLLPLCVSAAGIKITMSGGGKYAVGQHIQIQIEADGISDNLRLPARIPGCELVSNSYSQSSSITTGSGGRPQVTQRQVIRLIVLATQPGRHTFGPLQAGSMRSNSVSYSITASGNSGTAPAPAQSQPSAATAPLPSFTAADTDDIMVKVTVSDNTPYNQQGIIYTARIFFTQSVRYPQCDFPIFDNCSYEQIPVDEIDQQAKRVIVNGREYYTAVLYSLIVYPHKSGTIKIVGGNNTFSDGFSSRTVKANDVTLDVKELPEFDKHSDINGVGDYTVSAKLVSKEVRTGEAARIRFTVSGFGNPSFVSLPDLQKCLPDGFKLVKSDSRIEKNVDKTGVNATITFDCMVLPSKTGDYEIQPVEFVFFNPQTSRWYTRKSDTVKISVTQGEGSDEEENTLSFISELKPYDKGSAAAGFLITSPLYWICYLLPLAALIAMMIVYRKRMALLADRELLKRRRANSVARKRLRSAAEAMKLGNPDTFYDELLKAVWGYLSDKLSVPTSELSRGNVCAGLEAVGVQPQLAGQIIEFIDDCEFAKYGSSAGADMQAAYSRAAEMLDRIEDAVGRNDKLNRADEAGSDTAD